MRLIPDSLRKHGNFSEVVGIALLLLALLSCGSILSYDSADPVYLFKAVKQWFQNVSQSRFA